MSNLRKSTQNGLMHPETALKLLKLWIWLPDEIVQNTWADNTGKRHNLSRLNASREESKREFWVPVISGSVMGKDEQGRCKGTNLSRSTAEENHEMIKDLLMHLFWITAPRATDMKLVSGFWFDTQWYRRNSKLAWQFYQALQTNRVLKADFVWHKHEVWISEFKHVCFEFVVRSTPVVEDQPKQIVSSPVTTLTGIDEQGSFGIVGFPTNDGDPF